MLLYLKGRDCCTIGASRLDFEGKYVHMTLSFGLSMYHGPSGDHNDRAMSAVSQVGAALEDVLGAPAQVISVPVRAEPKNWPDELERSRSDLLTMALRIDEVMQRGQRPISAITRCAVALATQPVVVRHRPDTVVVWFDAHADINTPEATPTGYLGGMALSGPLGWWDSGMGAGLPSDQAVLVGTRDIDPQEQQFLEQGTPLVVAPGPNLVDRLIEAVGNRPVYFHFDCDVMEPGLFLTDYRVPNGLTLEDVHDCATALSANEIVGVEIGEFEGAAAASANDLVDALKPIIVA